MKPISRWLILAFVALGLFASFSAVYVHGRLILHPDYVSPCDINATVSCSAVYTSQYGSIRGVSVAVFGAIWFVFVALLTAGGFRGRPALRENFPGYLFAVSTVGLAVILYLAYAAFFVLKAVCIFCLLTYVAVIGLFLVSGMTTAFPMTTLPRRILDDLKALVKSPLALAISLVFAAGSVSAIAFFPREAPPGAVRPPSTAPVPQAPQAAGDIRSELEKYLATAKRVTIPISNDGAVVLIVKFSDYLCPACAGTHFEYKPILAKYAAEYPGAVKFVTKNFPLNTDCNTTLQRTINGHEASCDAAVSVALAKRQGRDTAMEEWLFTNQRVLTPLVVRQAAGTIGRIADWESGYASALNEVKADASLGRLLNVSMTPTFFVNGVPFPGPFSTPDLFDAAIAAELKRLGKTK